MVIDFDWWVVGGAWDLAPPGSAFLVTPDLPKLPAAAVGVALTEERGEVRGD